jgi:hypothetical protein
MCIAPWCLGAANNGVLHSMHALDSPKPPARLTKKNTKLCPGAVLEPFWMCNVLC